MTALKESLDYRLLVIDDDNDASSSICKALHYLHSNFSYKTCSTIKEALNLQINFRPQVIILDLNLNDKDQIGVLSGFNLLTALKKEAPHVRVIMLTGHASQSNGIRALELGAASFLEKPANLQHLSALVQDGFTQGALGFEVHAQRQAKVANLRHLLPGSSTQAIKLRSEVEFASFSEQSILLVGETGSGKGVTAKVIHKLGKRSEHPFIRFQATFSSADLCNSELYGHRKGAFTGALSDRLGLLKEADLGTFFLDEIDELPLSLQVSLLGTLQDKRFREVGSNKEITSNFRLIAAMNKDPESALIAGKLREDLYHRIAHFSIRLPPLRERLSDILEFCELELGRLRREEALQGIVGLTDGAINKLTSYPWPGNLREFNAVLNGAAFLSRFKGLNLITPEEIKLPLLENVSSSVVEFATTTLEAQVKIFKKKVIHETLNRYNGNQVRAAKALGIDRTTLRRILERV